MRGRGHATERRTFGRTLAVVAVVVCALSVEAARAQAPPPPHLEYIRDVLRARSPGTETNVWWLRRGNVLPEPPAFKVSWLLQTVNCWGQLECSKPPPGGKTFLEKVTDLAAVARKSVDIAHLHQLGGKNPGYPNGDYMDAIVRGLRIGHNIHPNDIPLVRLLQGVFPGTVPAPGAFSAQLRDRVGNGARVESASMRSCGVAGSPA